MNKSILFTLASSAVMLLAGCDETWNTGDGGEGRFNPVVTLTTAPDNSTSQKAPSRGTAAEIGVNDLSMRLTSISTGAVKTWNSVSDFDATKEFNVGPYNLEIYYGDARQEGYDKPAYYGATRFSIRENETTPVAVTAKLANTMLSINYTDAFRNYFSDYSVSIVSSTGNKIAWDAGRNAPVYFAPGQTKIETSVTKPNGTTATYQAAVFTAEPCHHYHLTLNVNDGNVGSSTLVLTFEDEMALEDVVIDLSDDLQNTPAPEIKTEGVTPGEPITIVTGNAAPLRYIITAHGGIASATLSTVSPSLIEKGWPAEIDLLAADQAMKTSMTSLGFEETGLWKNPDRMAVIDLSNVISNIRYFVSSANQSTFTLTVTDRLGRTAEPIEVSIVVENLQIVLLEPSDLYERGTELDITMNYNSTNPADVKFYAHNNRLGTEDEVNSEILGPVSRTMSGYRVKLTSLPPSTENLKLSASVDGFDVEANIEVIRIPSKFALNCNENDVFSNRATLSLQGQNGVEDAELRRLASEAVLYMSTNGGITYSRYEATFSDLTAHVSGLIQATEYLAYVDIASVHSNTVTFTTEAAVQLPNSDMEDWDPTTHTNYTMYNPWAAGTTGAAWNTYNPVTTSQHGSGYAYIINSGTQRSEDRHSGNYAALIRTVGWGTGNTASANAFNRWSFGNCKHVSAGQLFLGNWDNIEAIQDATPNYGYAFASRPASISFWYKYAVMNKGGNDNGQRGMAIIRLIAADGSVLTEHTVQLEPNAQYSDINASVDYSVSGSYIQKNIPFVYAEHAPKCESIIVIFKSTQYSSQELEANKNENHMRPPRPMNLSDGEYLGSSLFIDDITLNY